MRSIAVSDAVYLRQLKHSLHASSAQYLTGGGEISDEVFNFHFERAINEYFNIGTLLRPWDNEWKDSARGEDSDGLGAGQIANLIKRYERMRARAKKQDEETLKKDVPESG